MNSNDSLKGGGRVEKQTFWKLGSQCHFFFLSYIWFKIYKADSWCGALQTRHWGLPQEMVHCSTGSRQVGQDQSEPEVWRLQMWRAGEGVKKKERKKKPCHANDGLTSWRAVIRPAYWLTERQLKGNNECSQDREGPQRSEGGDGDCLGGLGRDSPLSPFLPTFTTHRVRRRQCRPHYRSRPPRLPSPAEQRTRVRDSTKSNLLCTTDGL